VITARLASLAGLGAAICGGWFATTELFLRHPGSGWRAPIAAAIVAAGALTIALFEDRLEASPAAVVRWPLTAGAAATAILGWWIVAEDVARPGFPARPHFEGYLLIVGLTLIAYGVLAVTAISVTRRNREARGDRREPSCSAFLGPPRLLFVVSIAPGRSRLPSAPRS
jgi:hypothetical protein